MCELVKRNCARLYIFRSKGTLLSITEISTNRDQLVLLLFSQTARKIASQDLFTQHCSGNRQILGTKLY